MVEIYHGYRVRKNPPVWCPRCTQHNRNGYMEPGLIDDEGAVFDDELARDFGLDPDSVDFFEEARKALSLTTTDDWEVYSIFEYIHLIAECDTCHLSLGYGPRLYWDIEAGEWSKPRPLTPKDRAELERASQIAAGQLALFPMEPAE